MIITQRLMKKTFLREFEETGKKNANQDLKVTEDVDQENKIC